MTSTTAVTQRPLCQAYKKPMVDVETTDKTNWNLRNVTSVPPVLFHGTAKYLIDRAIKSNETTSRLSLTPDPTTAACYASYVILNRIGGNLLLGNDSNRKFPVYLNESDETAPNEIQILRKGEVNSSLLLFDRDKILHLLKQNPEIMVFNDEGGLGLRGLELWDNNKFLYPLDALIASFDYRSNGTQTRSISVQTRIINPNLWEENFIVSSPKIQMRQVFPESRKPFDIFGFFVGKLFLGHKIL